VKNHFVVASNLSDLLKFGDLRLESTMKHREIFGKSSSHMPLLKTTPGGWGTPPGHPPHGCPNNPAGTIHGLKKWVKTWVFEVILHGKEGG